MSAMGCCCGDVSFVVPSSESEAVARLLDDNLHRLGLGDYTVDREAAKVSVVGAGLMSHPDAAARMLCALSGAGICVKVISTAENKISVVVSQNEADRAVETLHRELIGCGSAENKNSCGENEY